MNDCNYQPLCEASYCTTWMFCKTELLKSLVFTPPDFVQIQTFLVVFYTTGENNSRPRAGRTKSYFSLTKKFWRHEPFCIWFLMHHFIRTKYRHTIGLCFEVPFDISSLNSETSLPFGNLGLLLKRSL